MTMIFNRFLFFSHLILLYGPNRARKSDFAIVRGKLPFLCCWSVYVFKILVVAKKGKREGKQAVYRGE
ncbi:hypothetical protein HQ45_06920 [Porphyromonas crevioricanis]|uniref:Uncharacterized protein n=1 Tax=Porphyromonas crevioricanis JCM 15906 TaxID=1305617 RepID=S4N6N9_9PORP|nr:hypothetical protein HQ45_06920 [Porphyromonas crevioricanis]GAD04488.1 hypothetical protein PORCRE_173 [Porphyromonas crevioricanis JCM 15906]SJZ77170.1 hypothetical protein SAMN02745203_00802 [Porphyromonas crevioricanis]